MWADDHDDVQNKVNTVIPGIWYGMEKSPSENEMDVWVKVE